MSDRKTDFGWFCVLGDDGEWAAPEPGEIAHINGKRVVYTCGCADPFDWTGSTADRIHYLGLQLHRPNPGLIAAHPVTELANRIKRNPLRSHGWRGPHHD